MKSKLFTSSATSTDSVKLTAFKTSNKTAAVWYAFVSRALDLGEGENNKVSKESGLKEEVAVALMTYRSALSAAFCNA